MHKKTITLAAGMVAVAASLNAQAYTHTANLNGAGASARATTGFARIGLGPNGEGLQYHHWVDGLAPGETWTVTGDQYAMFDPMRVADGDAAAYGVGAQSWCQAGECAGEEGESEGWNHTSQHILFNLTEATDVTITLSNAPAVTGKHTFNIATGNLAANLIPAFTLFSGKSTTGTNDLHHTWQNQGSPHWSNITYISHDANPGNAGSITDTFHLNAGEYTLYIGGNKSNNASGKNYALTIAAASVNSPPTANAGSNQTVRQGKTVTLDGSGSTDPNHQSTLKYQWRQISGQSVTLSSSDQATATFVAPAPGTDNVLTFELVVTDEADAQSSAPAQVAITLVDINQAPILDLGSDKTATENTVVTLTPKTAADPDGDGLIYEWEQIGGTPVSLSGADTGTASFTAPLVSNAGETLTFKLKTTDDYAPNPLSSEDTLSVQVQSDAGLLDCSQAQPSRSSLWPTNRKMVKVSIDGITGPSPYSLKITGISQDEPVKLAPAKDKTGPDAKIIKVKTSKKNPNPQESVQLRAERHVKNVRTGSGSENGRVYSVSFSANDGTQSCDGQVQIHVPMVQGQSAVADKGKSYDSTKRK